MVNRREFIGTSLAANANGHSTAEPADLPDDAMPSTDG